MASVKRGASIRKIRGLDHLIGGEDEMMPKKPRASAVTLHQKLTGMQEKLDETSRDLTLKDRQLRLEQENRRKAEREADSLRKRLIVLEAQVYLDHPVENILDNYVSWMMDKNSDDPAESIRSDAELMSIREFILQLMRDGKARIR